MNAFNRLPGFTRCAPGLEHEVWRRLPAVWLWGTLLPLLALGAHRLLSAGQPALDPADPAALQWEFMLLGLVALHGSLVLTVGLGCFIVRVMKGPAYVADAYPLPFTEDAAPRGAPAKAPAPVLPPG